MMKFLVLAVLVVGGKNLSVASKLYTDLHVLRISLILSIVLLQ